MTALPDRPNNERLRPILVRAGLKPATAVTFNRGRERPVGFSTWCAWTAPASAQQYLPLPDDELAHAQRVFAGLLMSR